MSNLVTCCRACNEFGNRYKAAGPVPRAGDDEAFWQLRDRTFAERREVIRKCREAEGEGYERVRRFTWLPGGIVIDPEPTQG